MNQQQLYRWRVAATAAYLALFTWMGLWLWRDGMPSVLAMAIGWLPLWLPLPGILRGKPYTFAWSNFVVIPYLGHALMLAWVNPVGRPAAIIESVLAMAALLLTAYYTRFALRFEKQKDQHKESVDDVNGDER